MAPVWSKSDDDVLHEAVSSFGQQWSKVARQDGLAGRSVKSVRHRWLRISMQERSIALPPTPLSNGLPRLQASAAQWRPYHRDTRDRTGGRPWEYFVSCSVTRTRVPCDPHASTVVPAREYRGTRAYNRVAHGWVHGEYKGRHRTLSSVEESSLGGSPAARGSVQGSRGE